MFFFYQLVNAARFVFNKHEGSWFVLIYESLDKIAKINNEVFNSEN